MTIELFKEALLPFAANDVGAEFYFILNNGRAPIIKFADIDADAQEKLKDNFVRHIKESLIDNANVSLLNLSGADERKDAIYKYDLEEIPDDLRLLDDILNNQNLPKFSFRLDAMSDIKGILIRIGVDGQQLALYKKNYPISLIQRESRKTFMLRKSQHRFVELDSDVLKINPKFEFLKLNGEIYIIDLKSLEKFFGFTEIIIKEASRCVKAIEESGLLENPEYLTEQLTDISFSRKLTKVLADSPVLNVVPNEVVIDFVENHPRLKGKLKINEARTKLQLHTKKSRVLLVKLLNDDYLTSELTKKYYESLAKDSADE